MIKYFISYFCGSDLLMFLRPGLLRLTPVLALIIQCLSNKRTQWPESASELYRPSDRRLSAKLVLALVDRGVLRSQLSGSLMGVISVYWTGAATFSSK
jgi:hypothetical protein